MAQNLLAVQQATCSVPPPNRPGRSAPTDLWWAVWGKNARFSMSYNVGSHKIDIGTGQRVFDRGNSVWRGFLDWWRVDLHLQFVGSEMGRLICGLQRCFFFFTCTDAAQHQRPCWGSGRGGGFKLSAGAGARRSMDRACVPTASNGAKNGSGGP